MTREGNRALDAATRDELRELGYRYARAVDRGESESLCRLFTPDAKVGGMDETVPAFEGHDGLTLMVQQVGKMFVKTMHNVYNQTFDPGADDNIATGETYCLASHVISKPDGGWDLLDMAIRYQNDYKRDAEGWKFARRRLNVEWIETRPVQDMDPAFLAAKPTS